MKILSNKRIFFKRLWLMSNGWYWSHLILCSICFILISPYSLLDLLEPIQRQRRTSETKHDSNIFAFNTPTYYLTWNMYQNHYTALKVIRFSLNILTKIRVQNLYQTSASKYRPNCRQYVIQHQQQQHKNTKNFWVGIIKSQSHISQVSPTSVSQWVSYKGRQWSDAGW